MKDQIGNTAGAIWKVLNEQGRVALSRLPKAVNERDAVVYQAVGWLARENKVDYETKGKTTYVILTPADPQ